MASEEQCCCCTHFETLLRGVTDCSVCHHRWLTVNQRYNTDYYVQLSERNALPDRYIEQKNKERIDFLLPMLEKGMRVLEIGCAEGELGRLLKENRDIHYT